ncbi:MAG: hypothetical protein R2828_33745 [Saprospiraceae bacterium]
MKTFLLLAMVAVLVGCTTDFEIEAAWKDIPVVYGFLSTQDTAHYIRVEKAFLEPGGNALNLAQVADSLYYGPEVLVMLEKVATGERFMLERVDGNKEGYIRQPGPFANSPNILYKIKKEKINLATEDLIRLLIERGNGLPPVSAETKVIGSLNLLDNLPREPINLGSYNADLRIGWEVSTAAQLFDLRFKVHFRESRPDNPALFDDKTIEFVVDRSIERTDDNIRVNHFLRAGDFFQFLGSNLPVLDAGVRFFDGLDIQLVAAGEEFLELTRIGQANLGITSANEIPIYTNLSEGRGIFSSKASAIRENLPLGPVSLDSLRNGIYTAKLNFQ